jgi:lysophospholipase-2
VVPYRWGQLTSTNLKAFCKTHEFKTYKGLSHSSSPTELQDIKTFMQSLIPAEK